MVLIARPSSASAWYVGCWRLLRVKRCKIASVSAVPRRRAVAYLTFLGFVFCKHTSCFLWPTSVDCENIRRTERLICIIVNLKLLFALHPAPASLLRRGSRNAPATEDE